MPQAELGLLQVRFLELVDEPIEVEADAAEKLIDELVALIGDGCGLRDVGANIRFDDSVAVLPHPVSHLAARCHLARAKRKTYPAQTRPIHSTREDKRKE